MGVIWIISALAKKARVESRPAGVKESNGEEVYKASGDALERFLEMVSDNAEGPEPVVRRVPENEKVIKEAAVLRPEAAVPVRVVPKTAFPKEKPGVRGVKPSVTQEGLRVLSLSRMSLTELQRAIVLSEVLGLPRAMRPHRRYP